MPYDIEKRGTKYCLIKKATGKVHQCHDTYGLAKKAIKAIAISEDKGISPAERKG